LVVSLFPGIHRVFTVSVAVVGLLVLAYVLVRRRPTSPAALARLVGWVMTVAILLAPATRVGYLLYPVDFFVWAWLLRGEDSVDPAPEPPGARRPVVVGGSKPDEHEDPSPGDHEGPPPEGPTTGDGAGRTRTGVLASAAPDRDQA
jgi:hypothetical protein